MAIQTQGEGCDCKCPQCQPDAFPAEMFRETRATDAHRAVRFRDYPRDIAIVPYLDGVKVDDAIEGIAGPDSWLVVHSKDANGHIHPCGNCGNTACMTVLRGDVRFEPMEPAKAAEVLAAYAS